MEGVRNDQSRLCIRFGEEFDERDANIQFNISLVLSDELAKKFVKEFQQSTQNQIKPHYNIIFKFYCKIDRQKDLVRCFDLLFKGQEDDTPFGFLRSRVKQGDITYKYYQVDDAVYLVFGFKEDFFRDTRTFIMNLLEQGLGDIAFNQETRMSLDISSKNSFQDISDKRRSGETLSTALFSSLKLDLKFSNNKEFIQKVIEVFGNIDPRLKANPSLKMLLFFQSFNMEIDLESADIFPEEVSTNYSLSSIERIEKLKFSTSDKKILTDMLELLDNGFDFYSCIPNLLRLEGSCKGYGFKKYMDAFLLSH